MSNKIWVKYVKYGDDNKPVKVNIKECQDVDDLKSIIKEKLSNRLRFVDTDEMTLRKHGEEVDLDPECEVGESFVNTPQTPVQVFVKSNGTHL
jgi:Glu-tRNA(Gln) amidotransferase subunit E-like FAD-binding protein